MRRVSIIESMFKDVADRQELLVVDDLYRNGNKGSAIVFMLKRIRKQWQAFTGKGPAVGQSGGVESPTRVIKINEGGNSRFIARN